MTGQERVERLIADNPRLHYASPEYAQIVTGLVTPLAPGVYSMAVPPEVLRYFARTVQESWRTIETGSGQTTVALAILALHHTAIMGVNPETHALIAQYLERLAVPASKVTLVQDWSDTALPALPSSSRYDFAFVDGCHGYPFPALDWHYIDQRLAVGAIIGFDNTEIRCVGEHCRFLEENGDYELIERIDRTSQGGAYGANFYRKARDQDREWIFQRYNLAAYMAMQSPPRPGPAARARSLLRRGLRRARRLAERA
jgi:hypothetical protein